MSYTKVEIRYIGDGVNSKTDGETRDATRKKTLTLAKNVEYSFESIPVKWAPDSSFLIYENNNNLYILDMKEIINSTNLYKLRYGL